MTTLHIENTVRDYAAWKAVFDRFDHFRTEKRVRAYRLYRKVADHNQITIDLDFESVEDATAFRGALQQIWQTPQSRQQLISHPDPELYDLAEHRTLP